MKETPRNTRDGTENTIHPLDAFRAKSSPELIAAQAEKRETRRGETIKGDIARACADDAILSSERSSALRILNVSVD